MLSIVLIGTGNVARHLFDAFSDCDSVQIRQVIGRNKKALEYFHKTTEITSDYNLLVDADIYIIALSDDAINTVSELLKLSNKLVVHTSGSVTMQRLVNNRTGVFYPLQTFSKNRRINFKQVPICIEAENEADLAILHKLASTLSREVHEISAEQRNALHLSAVFVNNFTNHMFTIANEICGEHQLSFSILKPLILETTNKIADMPPFEAQTGPARRNDTGTMDKHLQLLNSKNQKDIYSLLSESILKTYEKKL
ncbi:DUF2520 domain-containing protein [Muriicola sp. Z0-33]|nr:DUF2520 domain-containing protein [Muriicola sp. Z0-33]